MFNTARYCGFKYYSEYLLECCSISGSILSILKSARSFRPSVLLVLPVLAVLRPPVLQRPQYSQYDMYSILRVYLERKVQWEHLCSVLQSHRASFFTPLRSQYAAHWPAKGESSRALSTYPIGSSVVAHRVRAM